MKSRKLTSRDDGFSKDAKNTKNPVWGNTGKIEDPNGLYRIQGKNDRGQVSSHSNNTLQLNFWVAKGSERGVDTGRSQENKGNTKEIQRGRHVGSPHNVYSQPPRVPQSYTHTLPSLSSIVSAPTGFMKPIRTFRFFWVYPRARRIQFLELAIPFLRDFCTIGGFEFQTFYSI